MEIILIGLPQSGKSTIFDILTDEEKAKKRVGSIEYNIARVPVSDQRLDRLFEFFPKSKKVNAQIDFIDMGGMKTRDKSTVAVKGLPDDYIHAIRNGDAFLVVLQSPSLRGIEDVAKSDEMILTDMNVVETELVFSDLSAAEKRHAKLTKEIHLGRNENKSEYDVVTKCLEHLNNEKPLRLLNFNHDEEKLLRGFCFLSQKPLLVVVNVSESELGLGKFNNFQEKIKSVGFNAVEICAQLESELKQLPLQDRLEFMNGLGMKTSGKDILISSAFGMLHLITFYTIGDDEVRAWTIPQGTSAAEAAGKIHTDIQRGFIKAEVIKYEDYITYKSIVELRKLGKLKLEGKEYVVEDGDLIEFKFNV
jgi:ribosome-binding ATPase